MSDFPRITFINPIVISPVSSCSLGSGIIATTGAFNTNNFQTNPVANLAVFVPFWVYSTLTITQIFWTNGTVGTDHIDVGIYTSNGTLLVSLGSTLTSGANSTQIGNITDTNLTPGLYYMALAKDGTTNTIAGCSTGIGTASPRALGVYEMTTAFPLPATATFAGATHAFIPTLCLTRSSIV